MYYQHTSHYDWYNSTLFCWYFLTFQIASVLILDHAGLVLSSLSNPAPDEVLDVAASRYVSSSIHNTVKKQFPGFPKDYSISQLTAFILANRL
jgi:hypothetical protein